MKVKVVKEFKNKYSKKIHKVGDTLDISDSRFKEINSTKHGILVKEIKEKNKKE